MKLHKLKIIGSFKKSTQIIFSFYFDFQYKFVVLVLQAWLASMVVRFENASDQKSKPEKSLLEQLDKWFFIVKKVGIRLFICSTALFAQF